MTEKGITREEEPQCGETGSTSVTREDLSETLSESIEGVLTALYDLFQEYASSYKNLFMINDNTCLSMTVNVQLGKFEEFKQRLSEFNLERFGDNIKVRLGKSGSVGLAGVFPSEEILAIRTRFDARK